MKVILRTGRFLWILKWKKEVCNEENSMFIIYKYEYISIWM